MVHPISRGFGHALPAVTTCNSWHQQHRETLSAAQGVSSMAAGADEHFSERRVWEVDSIRGSVWGTQDVDR